MQIETFAPLTRASMAATLAEKVSYLTRNDDVSKLYSLTSWIVADLESAQGREIVRGGLAHIKSSSQMRLAVIHNSETPGIFSSLNHVCSFVLIDLSLLILCSFREKFFDLNWVLSNSLY